LSAVKGTTLTESWVCDICGACTTRPGQWNRAGTGMPASLPRFAHALWTYLNDTVFIIAEICRDLSGLRCPARLERLILGGHIQVNMSAMCPVFVRQMSGFVCYVSGFCPVLCGEGCSVQILVIQARIRENVYGFVRFCPVGFGLELRFAKSVGFCRILSRCIVRHILGSVKCARFCLECPVADTGGPGIGRSRLEGARTCGV
jgi:hypothetical protein